MSNAQGFVERLLGALKTPTLQKYRNESKRIREKYTPRNIYCRWRDSKEGQDWKKEKYLQICGKCCSCGHIFPGIDYFTIDHIQPISNHPELAVDTKNLQLLCDRCNRKKGNSTDS